MAPPTINKRTMEDMVYIHLHAVGSISSLEAATLYKCRSLSRRIATLREDGLDIFSEWCKDLTGQRYVRYYISV